MNNSVIISVLDYFSGETDIFMTFLTETDPGDINVEVEDIIEERGHRIQDCHYLYTEPNKFKLKVDL